MGERGQTPLTQSQVFPFTGVSVGGQVTTFDGEASFTFRVSSNNQVSTTHTATLKSGNHPPRVSNLIEDASVAIGTSLVVALEIPTGQVVGLAGNNGAGKTTLLRLVPDEPFANPDPTSQYVLQQILAEMSKETNATIFVSSHDLGHVTDACERILLMNQGRIERDELISEQTLKELERFFARSVAV